MTATDPGAIPEPVRDRLEVIELSGYTEQEKLIIAERHLQRPFGAGVPGPASCLAPPPPASPAAGTGRRPRRADHGWWSMRCRRWRTWKR